MRYSRLPNRLTAQRKVDVSWHDRLNQVIRESPAPSQWAAIRLDVRTTFWNVLAYEHDGMAERVEAYRHECARSVEILREHFDSHPDLGPEVADACIAEEIDAARREFTHDLEREKSEGPAEKTDLDRQRLPEFLRGSYDWRGKRGRRRGYR
jgi:hypothetical protein